MINQEQNGDPKPGFGETNDPQKHPETDNSNKKSQDEKANERRETIEDTSSINYGNIGVEGGVEDLDEEE